MMDRRAGRLTAGEARLQAYLDAIAAVLGHASRASAMRAYCTGLLLPGERKSIELMAARVRPSRVRAAHQSMHHVVANAGWDDAAVLGAVLARVLPAMQRHGPVCSWHVESITFPKQGSHSVGVAPQPSDHSGKQDNCQVAVSLLVANEHASLPIAYRLYLPETWAEDSVRRSEAGVPEPVRFETKAAIALGQVRQASARGMPPGIVLGGAEFGGDVGFRSEVSGLGLLYALAVQSSTRVWPPAKTLSKHEPVSARTLALSLPSRAWRQVTWREGGRAGLSSRFAALRVRAVHFGSEAVACPEEWLLIEWPAGEVEPKGYCLSNLSQHTALRTLVGTAKARWRGERDTRELQRDLGLGHYEGRGWRGFHHHASLCIVAYGFLVADRCFFPLAQRLTPGQIAVPERPYGFRPRGSAHANRAARAASAGLGPAPLDERLPGAGSSPLASQPVARRRVR